MNELLEAIALEGGFATLKRKKESRRKFLNRWWWTQQSIKSAWDAVREGVDAEIGDKD